MDHACQKDKAASSPVLASIPCLAFSLRWNWEQHFVQGIRLCLPYTRNEWIQEGAYTEIGSENWFWKDAFSLFTYHMNGEATVVTCGCHLQPPAWAVSPRFPFWGFSVFVWTWRCRMLTPHKTPVMSEVRESVDGLLLPTPVLRRPFLRSIPNSQRFFCGLSLSCPQWWPLDQLALLPCLSFPVPTPVSMDHVPKQTTCMQPSLRLWFQRQP